MNISFLIVQNNDIMSSNELQGDFILLYLLTFLEGIISFISPCMLPMLPIYISYFAGKADKKQHILLRALAFVLGFTLVFTGLGLFAGTLSFILVKYRQIVQIVCGMVVVLFGLSYLEVFHLPFFKGIQKHTEVGSVFSAFVFGVIYSINLTPCVGVYLGSALMIAGTSGGAFEGALLLLFYSLGLGIPFLLSAILIDKLNVVFTFIKQHYKIVNLISGLFLVLTGLFMMFGIMNRILAFFS